MMNTSTEALNQLRQAQAATTSAQQVVDNLIAAHDYQDVTSLVVRSAASMLESALQLMQNEDEAGLDALERAEDLIEAVYDIIEGEVEDE